MHGKCGGYQGRCVARLRFSSESSDKKQAGGSPVREAGAVALVQLKKVMKTPLPILLAVLCSGIGVPLATAGSPAVASGSSLSICCKATPVGCESEPGKGRPCLMGRSLKRCWRACFGWFFKGCQCSRTPVPRVVAAAKSDANVGQQGISLTNAGSRALVHR